MIFLKRAGIVVSSNIKPLVTLSTIVGVGWGLKTAFSHIYYMCQTFQCHCISNLSKIRQTELIRYNSVFSMVFVSNYGFTILTSTGPPPPRLIDMM